MLRAVLAAAAGALLGGCGRKGALYLPLPDENTKKKEKTGALSAPPVRPV